MFDDEPWFRRWFGFSFMPVTWQGWATTVAFFLVEVPLGLLSLKVEGGSLAWWLLGAIFVAIFLGFWALAVWKTEAS